MTSASSRLTDPGRSPVLSRFEFTNQYEAFFMYFLMEAQRAMLQHTETSSGQMFTIQLESLLTGICMVLIIIR